MNYKSLFIGINSQKSYYLMRVLVKHMSKCTVRIIFEYIAHILIYREVCRIGMLEMGFQIVGCLDIVIVGIWTGSYSIISLTLCSFLTVSVSDQWLSKRITMTHTFLCPSFRPARPDAIIMIGLPAHTTHILRSLDGKATKLYFCLFLYKRSLYRYKYPSKT